MKNLLQPFGIKIRVHFSFIIIIVLVLPVFAGLFKDLGSAAQLFWGLSTFVLIWTGLLAHELGHSVVAQHYGIKVPKIILHCFGGTALISSYPKSLLQEFFITVAGPAVSFVYGGIFFLTGVLFLSVGNYETINEVSPIIICLLAVGIVSIFIGLINILFPSVPTDGGRIFRSLFGMITGRFLLGWKISCWNLIIFLAVFFSFFGFDAWDIIFFFFLGFLAFVSYPREGLNYICWSKRKIYDYSKRPVGSQFYVVDDSGRFLGIADLITNDHTHINEPVFFLHDSRGKAVGASLMFEVENGDYKVRDRYTELGITRGGSIDFKQTDGSETN